MIFHFKESETDTSRILSDSESEEVYSCTMYEYDTICTLETSGNRVDYWGKREQLQNVFVLTNPGH